MSLHSIIRSHDLLNSVWEICPWVLHLNGPEYCTINPICQRHFLSSKHFIHSCKTQLKPPKKIEKKKPCHPKHEQQQIQYYLHPFLSFYSIAVVVAIYSWLLTQYTTPKLKATRATCYMELYSYYTIVVDMGRRGQL